MSPTDIQTFAASQLALLEVEHSAEIEETAILTATHAPIVLQRAGLALLNLHVVGQRTGFAGRTQIDLALDPTIANGDLPEHGLSSGDLCAVAEQPKGSEKKRDREVIEAKKVTGVVQRVRREDISVALDKDDAEMPQGGKLWLYVQPQQFKLEHDQLLRIVVGTGRLIDKFSSITASNSPTRLHINASPRL
jgi:DNA polymerase alpha-associated DNA helicase A